MVPHCHFHEIEKQITSAHENEHHHLNNHKHATNKNREADTIQHENHLDNSFFDFVICLFNQLEHPAVGIEHQHFIVTDTKDNSSGEIAKLKSAVLLSVVVNLPLSTEFQPPYTNYMLPEPQVPCIVFSPHRGPPSFFFTA